VGEGMRTDELTDFFYSPQVTFEIGIVRCFRTENGYRDALGF
jgi:hypothetical protein